jgi:flagellar biosynthesis protein FliQ
MADEAGHGQCPDRNGREPFTKVTRRHSRKGGGLLDLSLSLQDATDLIRHTLVLALVVSAPMLLIGLAVGIIVSLLQAVTQIQEQTLTFIPKIVAMVAAAILLMPWMSQRLLEYSAAIFLEGRIP